MALTVITLSLLLVALGLSQAWMLWYLRRQVSRLDQRLDESLDDQDLLDFQERLQDLMAQARESSGDMVRSVTQRQDALEKTLTLVREAEKQLVARAKLLEHNADAIAKRAEKLKAEVIEKKARRANARPERPAKAPGAPEPKPAHDAEQGAPETPKANEAARSYLVRPPAPEREAGPAASGRHQRIYELSDQGLSRDQIAKESGVLPGEVELILNLRPRRRDR